MRGWGQDNIYLTAEDRASGHSGLSKLLLNNVYSILIQSTLSQFPVNLHSIPWSLACLYVPLAVAKPRFQSSIFNTSKNTSAGWFALQKHIEVSSESRLQSRPRLACSRLGACLKFGLETSNATTPPRILVAISRRLHVLTIFH